MRLAGRAVALALLCCAGCARAPSSARQALQDGTFAMGTALEISLYGDDLAALARARDAVFAEAHRLDALLSNWSDQSDVSRLNRAAGEGAVAVDAAVFDLLSASVRHSIETRGSFDVTVGPLVALWSRAGERNALPSRREIDDARARVGAARIALLPDARIALPEGMAIDVGGIAKGFAVDRAVPILREAGIESALLNFGQSSSFALGAPPGSPDGWRLLARAPEGGFAGVLTLRDRALSVSGSLGQWSEIEGRRYGHVIDPRSGLALVALREALVLAPDATRAEALSKALLVLGEREGIEVVAGQPGCEGLLLGEGGLEVATAGWRAATRYEPLARTPDQGSRAD